MQSSTHVLQKVSAKSHEGHELLVMRSSHPGCEEIQEVGS